ncbi:uncharacterized protein LOC128230180 [Mya arenaria]|uniref:uncharacterized protein LOC128230180 n=1 Tax=Mya arenaria TaxID=6604 RepID=UPI0022E07D2D|nr:uncharacterized protein LOC128230180 [Mya arenaria]
MHIGIFRMTLHTKSCMHGFIAQKRCVSLCLRPRLFSPCWWSHVELQKQIPGRVEALLAACRRRPYGWALVAQRETAEARLSTHESGVIGVSTSGHAANGGDKNIFGLMMSLKSDFNKGMDDRNISLNSVNFKINEVFSVCMFIKAEKDLLKDKNVQLQTKLGKPELIGDGMDGQSRRNNLLIDGCQGEIYESSSVTQNKVKHFLSDTLLMHNVDIICIKSAQRLPRGGSEGASTIIVRFASIMVISFDLAIPGSRVIHISVQG